MFVRGSASAKFDKHILKLLIGICKKTQIIIALEKIKQLLAKKVLPALILIVTQQAKNISNCFFGKRTFTISQSVKNRIKRLIVVVTEILLVLHFGTEIL